MADEGKENAAEELRHQHQQLSQPDIPIHRVKKIMKLDKDVKKINSEAAFLVAKSTDLFLQFLAEISAGVAVEKKKKTIKVDHLRIAVKRHQPTSDFLLDSLPVPSQPSDQVPKERSSDPKPPKPAPSGTRRIDSFFDKSN